jgi:hypothetical protein
MLQFPMLPSGGHGSVEVERSTRHQFASEAVRDRVFISWSILTPVAIQQRALPTSLEQRMPRDEPLVLEDTDLVR